MAATSPNSALLLGVSSTAAAQRARVAAAAQVLEDRKASALAAERYEDCAVLRDALVPLRAQSAGEQQPLEAALLAALRGRDAPAPTSSTSPLYPHLRSAAWRADNRYFSAEVDLLALPPVEEEPHGEVRLRQHLRRHGMGITALLS